MGFTDIYFASANQQLKKEVLRGFWIYPDKNFLLRTVSTPNLKRPLLKLL